jgi:restriction system protein
VGKPATQELPIWGIHMGKGHADRPIVGGFISIGWSKIGDLSRLPADRDAFKKAFQVSYPQIKPAAVPVVAGTLFRFVSEMKIGDLVIYPSKIDRMVNLGTIKGGYEFNPSSDDMDGPNRRLVKWTGAIARSEFSRSALHEIGAAVTLFRVKNNADEFLAAFERRSP